jgi:hypothetical protein
MAHNALPNPALWPMAQNKILTLTHCTPEIALRWAPGANRDLLPILAAHSDRKIPPPKQPAYIPT